MIKLNFNDFFSLSLLLRIGFIVVSVALSSCAVLQPLPTDSNVATDKASSSSDPLPSTATPAKKLPPGRPDIELDQETLYQLLLAEIAGQRGKLDISVDNYLRLARKTRDPKVVERATRIAVYARDDAAATEAATLWKQIDPDNVDARQVLAVMAIRNGQIPAAVAELESIIQQNEGQMDQKLWMIANMLGREKDQETVMVVMERLMNSHQSDPNALFAYAHVLTRMGNLQKAEELLKEIMRIEPTNENAAVTYVSLLQRQEKKTEAIVWLEERLAQQPDSFNLKLVHARLLADAKRFDEAQIEFEKLDQKYPENIDVIYALGILHLQSNRLDEAKTYFTRLTKFNLKADEAGYYLGRITEDQKAYQEAETWYGGVQKGEHYLDAQIRIGMLMALQGRIAESRKHFQSILTKSKEEESLVLQAEAQMLIVNQRNQEALQVYNRTLDDRYDPDLLYARAMLAEKLNRLDILEADLNMILENDPDNSQALNALGYTLADRTERYQEAYGYIKRALEISPDDYYILDSMGWVLYRLGRLDESIEYLRKALEMRADPEIAAHLGEVLWVKGDKESAKTIWDTALKETPDDSRLLDVINRFLN